MTLKLQLPIRTGEVLTERMEELKLSIADLAEKVGTSYEHVRNITKGNIVPSKLMVRGLAEALKIKREELDRIATADRIRVKFGTIPLELAGKNPELEPLERVWNHLSKEHKADLIAQAQAWAKRDREAAKRAVN
jgi:transcriptional regulator with XRE-family HTH domain